MNEQLAVSAAWRPANLKKELLLFDRIVLFDQRTPEIFAPIFAEKFSEFGRFNAPFVSESADIASLMSSGALVDAQEYGIDFEIGELSGEYAAQLSEGLSNAYNNSI